MHTNTARIARKQFQHALFVDRTNKAKSNFSKKSTWIAYISSVCVYWTTHSNTNKYNGINLIKYIVLFKSIHLILCCTEHVDCHVFKKTLYNNAYVREYVRFIASASNEWMIAIVPQSGQSFGCATFRTNANYSYRVFCFQCNFPTLTRFSNRSITFHQNNLLIFGWKISPTNQKKETSIHIPWLMKMTFSQPFYILFWRCDLQWMLRETRCLVWI